MLISKRAKVVSDKPAYKKKEKGEDGGTIYRYDEKHVEKRWKEKRDKLKKLEKGIDKVRTQYKKDLKSDDERTRAIAAIVGIMDETAMRIGNEDSAKEGTYGASTLKVKHIKNSGGKMKFDFPGKGAIEQHVELKDAAVRKVIKDLMKGKKANDFIFEVDGKKIWDRAVNRYLNPLGISAKDLRGFHANRLMKEMLKKKDFKEALEEVADIVGHKSSTLKNQYLDPELVEKNEKKDKGGGKKKASRVLSKRAADPRLERFLNSLNNKYYNAGPTPDAISGADRSNTDAKGLSRMTREQSRQIGIRPGVKYNDLILSAWASLKPFLPSSAVMTSGAREIKDQIRIIDNYWRKTRLNEKYPDISDPFQKSKLLIQNGWIVGPPKKPSGKNVHLTHRAFDVSGAGLDEIASAAKWVSKNQNIPVRFSQILIERKNNAVHIGIAEAQYDPAAVQTALQSTRLVSSYDPGLVKNAEIEMSITAKEIYNDLIKSNPPLEVLAEYEDIFGLGRFDDVGR